MPTTTKIGRDAPAGNSGGPWTITARVANGDEKESAAEGAPENFGATESSIDEPNHAKTKKISRERGRWELRAKLRRVSVNTRTRGCGARCISGQGAAIEVRVLADGARARWLRLLRCGHVWTCPVCASDIRAKRKDQVIRAVSTGTAAPWRMLTLTLRHHAGEPLKPLLDGLMKAWRKTRQQGAVQRLWKARVSASIRAVEVTHGEHGWHPHLHVLLQSDESGAHCDLVTHRTKCKPRSCVCERPWTEEAHQTLLTRWRRMVVKLLGAAHVPDDDVGVRWSRPLKRSDDAGYLTKLGLEMSWGEKPTRGKRSRGPWTIARDAVGGDLISAHLWREYEAATRGRRALELDDRAATLAKLGEQLALAETLNPEFSRCVSCGHSAAEHFQPPIPLRPVCCGRHLHKKKRACQCEAFVEPERTEAREAPIEILDVESHAVYLLRRGEGKLPGIMWHVLRAIEDRPHDARATLDGWIHWAGQQQEATATH